MRRFFVYTAMCLMALSVVSCADNEKKENIRSVSCAFDFITAFCGVQRDRSSTVG